MQNWIWGKTLISNHFRVKGHNWVGFTYCDYNLYLVITKLIHKFKTTGWLQGHLSLSSFQHWMNDYQEFLVKSKLSPHSGSVQPWGNCTPSTQRGHKVLCIRAFQKAVRSGGKSSHPVRGQSELLLAGSFLPGERNLRRSNFDNSNFF